MTPSEPGRVLIVDPAYLGDAVFDAALARAVKARWPAAEVGLVLRPPADQLGPFMPYVDRVHVFDKRGGDKGLRGLLRVARAIAAEGYDRALVPHPSLRSAWLARAAGIPDRVGSAPGWWPRRSLTEVVDARDAGLVDGRLALLAPPPPLEPLAGALACEVRPGADAPVGLVLGSEWATKRWPVARAAEAVRGLGGPVRVIGAPWETPLMDELARALGDEVDLQSAHAPGIDALVRAVAGCAVVVAGDTGPLHIARALGVPTVALFGPTTEHGHPLGDQDRVLIQPIECRPCSAHGGARCPEGHHRCLGDLAGGRVAEAVRALRSGEGAA